VTKAAADKAAESKGAESKGAADKASETKASETKASETKASETKASETKASETKAAATKTASARGAVTKAVSTRAARVESTSAKEGPAKEGPAKAAPRKTSRATTAKPEAPAAGPTAARTSPSKTVPPKAAPSKASPTKALPTKAVPTKAVPTKAVPTKAVQAKGAPSKAASSKAASPRAAASKAAATKTTATKAAAAAKVDAPGAESSRPSRSASRPAAAGTTPPTASTPATAKQPSAEPRPHPKPTMIIAPHESTRENPSADMPPRPETATVTAPQAGPESTTVVVPHEALHADSRAEPGTFAVPQEAQGAESGREMFAVPQEAQGAESGRGMFVVPQGAPRVGVPAESETTMVVAPQGIPHDGPSGETPSALVAARSAAHAAAAIAAGEAELRRSAGSVTSGRGRGAGIRPPIGPAESRTAAGSDFVAANATARRGPSNFIEGTVAGAQPSRATRRMYQRRRRATLLVFLALTVLVLVAGQLIGDDEDRMSRVTIAPAASALPDLHPMDARLPDVGVPTAAELTRPATAVGQAPADTTDTAPAWPAAGADTGFFFVGGYGPVLGTTGTLRRFKVAVEQDIGQGHGGDFAHVVDRILGDRRSWIAGRQVRLRRVPQPAASEFTIYLASADTSEKMCGQGGLETDGFTSCRLPGRVIINVDRWADAVPDYDAPLDTYRAYAINHEVGHQLGHGHETCPGKGRPAPVMMQQTYGLKGCVPYSWPYLDGQRYSGTPTA